MEREIKLFIKDFSKEIEEENAAIFAGAGLSIPSGYVDWKNLLSPIAEELGLNIEKENDLVSLAQYHCNENAGNRSKLNQILMDEFGRSSQITENHRILSRLPIYTYWTTNYDKLIENALEQANKNPDVKYTVEQLAITRPKRDAVVYKMHGDINHPDKAILTKDDYESYYIKMAPFITALSGDLVSKTFLFIGFSFTDPNLDYILSRIRITYSQNQRRHYCFMKKISKNDDETQTEYEYRLLKQTLFINDLLRFNIKTILLDDYYQITEILKIIENKYKQKTIFISGSANEYGSWSAEQAEKFIKNLSQKLIDSDFKIVSGFGLGVGNNVILGALESIYLGEKRRTGEQLILRPFPQYKNNEKNKKSLWHKYRNDMISLAGISIFLFGNKKEKNKLVLADGVEKEFNISVDQNLKVIPVGSTGFMSEKLWKEVINNFGKYYPNHSPEFKNDFLKLGDKSIKTDQLVNLIVNIINQIQKE